MRGQIELRGVAVHNLKRLDLDIPRRQLVAICGVSGSGKTSLALDTLYAEGQRRYIETFSLHTRQFFEQLDKPEADRIDGLPVAIAVAKQAASRSRRSTVGASTEILDHLRLLYARIGRLICPACGTPVQTHSPESAAQELSSLPDGLRLMIGFVPAAEEGQSSADVLASLKAAGFVRLVAAGQTLDVASVEASAVAPGGPPSDWIVIIDRLTAGAAGFVRLQESMEIAFRHGGERAVVLIDAAPGRGASTAENRAGGDFNIDAKAWRKLEFSTRLECLGCRRQFARAEPRSLSWNSPLGACPTCEGFGNVIEPDIERIVPDAGKTIREGAIAPWNAPAYKHELDELLALAEDFGIPVDVPFRDLDAPALRIIWEGAPERSFGGLKGFFRWLERRKYKMHLRVFLNRWRSSRICPTCNGRRLNEEALAWNVAGKTLADVSAFRIDEARQFFRELALSEYERRVVRSVLHQIESRLAFLQEVGLDYLTLDRGLASLSGGEAQRVALTSTLGSSLVNVLYVLDEPSAGLHAKDVGRLVASMRRLRDRGNSVVVVEHEEHILRAADQLIEIGPAAGSRGGEVVFQGSPADMLAAGRSVTGDFLAGRRGISVPSQRRAPQRGRLRLIGARGNNLKNLTVEFPLGLLCVVTGVSGAGKSTLVQETLYGAICRRKKKDCDPPLPFEDLVGDGQIDDVMLIDATPIGRSPRSNPVTYIKAFDAIRTVFAETVEARTHNYTAGHFSFNVEGGRCTACEGEGFIQIDMQFMADVFMKCGVCGGDRYRPEILAVKYRGRNIAEVLAMTVREAFVFFRGQSKVQARLKQLIDVGLEYLQLGQPANTLSAGESQRLKLAAHLSAAGRSRTLFLLDEPTTGLHFTDVVTLLDCFDALLAVGHSLIVVEHNLQLIRAADYILDLGPGAGESGGAVVCSGTPEEVAACPASFTGQALRATLDAQPGLERS